MNLFYRLSPLAILALVGWAQQASAQGFTTCPANEDVCVVEWGTPQGEPIINALRNTIANDTDRPEGRPPLPTVGCGQTDVVSATLNAQGATIRGNTTVTDGCGRQHPPRPLGRVPGHPVVAHDEVGVLPTPEQHPLS
jgi:hypothetical protein